MSDDHNVWKITKFWFWDKENGLKFQSNMSINGNHKRFKVVYNTIFIQFGLPAGVKEYYVWLKFILKWLTNWNTGTHQSWPSIIAVWNSIWYVYTLFVERLD